MNTRASAGRIVVPVPHKVADAESKFILERWRAGIEGGRAAGIYAP